MVSILKMTERVCRILGVERRDRLERFDVSLPEEIEGSYA
jgi:hypothetical protein